MSLLRILAHAIQHGWSALMAWLGIGVGITDLPVYQHSGGGTPTPTPSIGTPVITQTSTSGASPFAWSIAEDATFFPGDFWEVARTTGANTSAASTALGTATPAGAAATQGSLNGYALQQITQADLVDTSTIVFTDLASAPAGALALRIRVVRDDGAGGITYGGWSNILTDAIIATSTAVLASTTGSNKNQYIDVTGTPKLTASMNNDLGAPCNVRATQTASGKAHWEVTLNSNSSQFSNFSIGVCDSSLVLGAAVFPRPGNGTDSGCSINIPHSASTVNLYANGAYVGDYALIGAYAAGDLIVIEFDTAAHTVSFWHSRSGTHLLLVTVTLTANIPTNWSAVVAGNGNVGAPDSMTVNFGATTFAKAPSSGYSMYG